MEHLLYPKSPVRVIITGKSNCGKTSLLLKILLNIIANRVSQIEEKCVKGFDKLFIYSPTIHQENYKNLIQMFETVVSAYPNIDELKNPEEYDNDYKNVIILDDLSEKELKDNRVQMLFKRGRHNNINTIYISQSYFHLPRKTIRNNSNFLILFKLPMKDVENIYQDLVSADMVIKEFKTLCQLAWSKPFGYLIIDLTKDRFLGKYRVGVDQFYLPESNPLS